MDCQNNEGFEGPSKADSELDSFTRGFVRKCARQLVGKFGFQQQDRDEIEQLLYLKLAKRLHTASSSDPKWKAFVAITVRRHVVSIVRHREAEKRDYRQTCSIEVGIGSSGESVELGATLMLNEIPSHRGRNQRTEQELVDLTLDVSACIADVSDSRQREFLERLKTASIAQIARDMDVPRTTLNSWLLKLRKHFETRGLREYL